MNDTISHVRKHELNSALDIVASGKQPNAGNAASRIISLLLRLQGLEFFHVKAYIDQYAPPTAAEWGALSLTTILAVAPVDVTDQVAAHCGQQWKNLPSEAQAEVEGIILVCDMDDTLMPSFMDTSFPRGRPYAGISDLFRRLLSRAAAIASTSHAKHPAREHIPPFPRLVRMAVLTARPGWLASAVVTNVRRVFRLPQPQGKVVDDTTIPGTISEDSEPAALTVRMPPDSMSVQEQSTAAAAEPASSFATAQDLEPADAAGSTQEEAVPGVREQVHEPQLRPGTNPQQQFGGSPAPTPTPAPTSLDGDKDDGTEGATTTPPEAPEANPMLSPGPLLRTSNAGSRAASTESGFTEPMSPRTLAERGLAWRMQPAWAERLSARAPQALHPWACMGCLDLLTGYLQDSLKIRAAARNRAIAATKSDNFKRWSMLYPECVLVFLGDSGQGDIAFAQEAKEHHRERDDMPRPLLTLIHDVVPFTSWSTQKPCTPASQRAVLNAAGVVIFDSYVEVASELAMARLQRPLLLPEDVQAVADGALADMTPPPAALITPRTTRQHAANRGMPSPVRPGEPDCARCAAESGAWDPRATGSGSGDDRSGLRAASAPQRGAAPSPTMLPHVPPIATSEDTAARECIPPAARTPAPSSAAPARPGHSQRLRSVSTTSETGEPKDDITGLAVEPPSSHDTDQDSSSREQSIGAFAPRDVQDMPAVTQERRDRSSASAASKQSNGSASWSAWAWSKLAFGSSREDAEGEQVPDHSAEAAADTQKPVILPTERTMVGAPEPATIPSASCGGICGASAPVMTVSSLAEVPPAWLDPWSPPRPGGLNFSNTAQRDARLRELALAIQEFKRRWAEHVCRAAALDSPGCQSAP